VRFRAARQYHHPAGLLIQAVNHPQPPVRRLQQPPQVGDGVIVPVGDGEHPGGLVDHQNIAIAVDDGNFRFQIHAPITTPTPTSPAPE